MSRESLRIYFTWIPELTQTPLSDFSESLTEGAHSRRGGRLGSRYSFPICSKAI